MIERAASIERDNERRSRPFAYPSQRFASGRAAVRTGIWSGALLRRLLALADVMTVACLALAFATLLGQRLDQAVVVALLAPAWVATAKLQGLYDRDQRALRHLTIDEFPTLVLWAGFGLGLTTLAFLALSVTPLTADRALESTVVVVTAAVFLRGAARIAWRRCVPPERALIVGDGPLAGVVRRKLTLFPDIHVVVVDERATLCPDELVDAGAWLADVDRIIVASPSLDEPLIATLVRVCRRERVKLSIVPPARGMFGTAVQLNHVADLPLVEYSSWDPSRSTVFLKRVLDIAISLPALLLLTPLFALIAVAVKLDSRGPVLFVQPRAGRNGRPFRMLKFRTMVADAEEQLADLIQLDELRDPMFKLANDPRVTRVGRLLRHSSLDELPQLVNVLAGSMSLVGPRPEQIELVERYSEEHRFRLSVKPGVTGPMQVYGRGELTFAERLAVEREYIENLSLGRDLRIIAMTFAVVVMGRGAF